MARYHLVTSTDRSGAYAEFTAHDDGAAIERALDGARRGWHGRPVSLSEVVIGSTDHHRNITLDTGSSLD